MKRLVHILVVFCVVLALSIFAAASSNQVCDDARLLTPKEVEQLADHASDIYEEYDIWAGILTVDSLGGRSTASVADAYFGKTSQSNGVLLLISMENRDWEIATYGRAANMITDSELDDLFSDMANDLAEDDYFSAFSVFLSGLERILKAEMEPSERSLVVILLISVGIGAVVAVVALLIMRASMNSVRSQREAANYLQAGSFRLTTQRDIYLYSNVTKVRKPDNNSSGSGGGRSRGGSRGKF